MRLFRFGDPLEGAGFYFCKAFGDPLLLLFTLCSHENMVGSPVSVEHPTLDEPVPLHPV